MTEHVEKTELGGDDFYLLDEESGMVLMFQEGAVQRAYFEPEVLLRKIGFDFEYDKKNGKIVKARFDGRPITPAEMEEYYLATSTVFYDLGSGELYCKIFTDYEFEFLSLVKERIELPRLEGFSRK